MLEKINITPFQRGALPCLHIENRYADAEISLYGAHVLSFIPKGESDLLFVSRQAVFQEGKAIRGGIPVCWPWFGPAGTPAHGVARISMWQLDDAFLEADASTTLRLSLDQRDFCGLTARLRVNVGNALTVSLTTHNCGSQTYELSEALHTYFAVGDIAQTALLGLAPDEIAAPLRDGRMTFEAETDLVATPGDKILVIDDPVKKRKICIARFNSGSVVVWNPWIDKSARLADLGNEEYREFLCVETANVKAQTIFLTPGAEHTESMRISLAL